MYKVSNTVYIVSCKDVKYKLWQIGTTTEKTDNCSLQNCCQFIMIHLKDIGSAWDREKNRHNVCQIVIMVNILTVLYHLLWLQPMSVNLKKIPFTII